MASSLQKYTVQEAQNIQLGQCRSAYIDSVTSYTTNTGEVVIAIQVIQDCKFTTLTAEDPVNCWGDSAIGLGHAGGTGDDVLNTTLFPAGLVLYGRWTTIEIDSGVAVYYMGR